MELSGATIPSHRPTKKRDTVYKRIEGERERGPRRIDEEEIRQASMVTSGGEDILHAFCPAI